MAPSPASVAKREDARRAAAGQVACWQCGAALAPDYFCPHCGSILAIPDDADYFQVLGVPRRLLIDADALQQRYYELHRQLHPDRFQTGPQEARVASLRNTAAVNRAYSTLRDPIERGIYWLSVQGESLGANNNRVPPELAEIVFETQEQLEELRAARGTDAEAARRAAMAATRRALAERRAALLDDLRDNYGRWDAQADDATTLQHELKEILSRLAYLGTLLRDVDRELEP
jgi:molecular chaperone HscB